MGKNITVPAILSIFVFTVLISSSMGSADAAIDMFLKIDGIDGESKDAVHKDEIDVLAWSWGAINTGSTGSGTGASSGATNLQDFSFTKFVDKSTPDLYSNTFNGEIIPEAKLTVRRSGDKPLDFLVITFINVIVSSVSTGGSAGAEELTENVTLSFAKIKIEYTPQKSDGSAGTKNVKTWDIVKSEKF